MAARKAAKKPATKQHKTPRATKVVVTGGDVPLAHVPAPPPSPASEEMQAKLAAIDAIANKYNSKGHMVMARGDQASNPYTLRRPTGIIPLDVDLGGGFPAGGTCFISGPDNSGKTHILMLTIALQQRILQERAVIGYGVSEGPFPYDQALRAGVSVAVPDELIWDWNQIRTQRRLDAYTDAELNAFKQQVGHFRILRGSTGEELLSVLVELAATKAFDILSLDSIQGLQPAVDAGKELTDAEKRAAHATMMGRFFKKYIPITTGLDGTNRTTVLMTQQVRSNDEKAAAPSYMQAALKDFKITGAYTSKHFKLIDVMFWDGATIKKDIQGRGKVAIGKTMKWLLEKGKAGTHDNKSGEVAYMYDIPTGVDLLQSVVDAGLHHNIIRANGKKLFIVRPDTGELLFDTHTQSVNALKQLIASDIDLELLLRTEIMTAAGVQCLYRRA